MNAPAVVLLSGGMDSATVLAIAQAEGFTPYALSFRYGQRHAAELGAARQVADAAGHIQHRIVNVDLRLFGGSALTGDTIAVPQDLGDDGIPGTYVPARNTIFLSFALAWAETLGASDVFIGVNALDYGGYPDCRPGYLRAYERMARLATGAAVEGRQELHIHAPLIDLTKQQIIERGLALGVDFSLTWSCYDPAPSGHPCHSCAACLLRAQGFAAAGIYDPALTRERTP